MAGVAVGSTLSTSAQVGQLLRRAMSLFESNRAMAWSCLSDAARLLGSDSDAMSALETSGPITLRPGGLSVWQAKRALAYMEANLGSKIGVAEISALVGLSKSHFCRAFKLALGTPPMAYFSIRRIERAKTLITSTSERLCEIALACGFADQSHLNRTFSRMLGTSPGSWRRSTESAPEVVRRRHRSNQGCVDQGGAYGNPKLRLEKTVSKSASSEGGETFVHMTFRSQVPEVGMVKLACPF